MICSAIPVVKPVITALETKFIIAPNRSNPNSSMTAPATSTSAAMLEGSVGSSPAALKTLWDVRASALVRVVTISTVRANSDPTIVDTTPE